MREGSTGADAEPAQADLAHCASACSSAADCVSDPSSRLYDQDNYACNDGECVHLGCNSDVECAAVAPNTVCRLDLDSPRCTDACVELSDCGDGERVDSGLIECVEGGCTYVGCSTDAQCPASSKCIWAHDGIRDCAFPCDTADDCAQHAQEELGLTGPDPNDPFTHPEGFVCLQGICFGNVPGCTSDAECLGLGWEAAVCHMPE